MLPIFTEGKARGFYRCIPKVSKQLPGGNNRLRLWLIPFRTCMKYEFLMRCLSDFKDLVKSKHILHTIV